MSLHVGIVSVGAESVEGCECQCRRCGSVHVSCLWQATA